MNGIFARANPRSRIVWPAIESCCGPTGSLSPTKAADQPRRSAILWSASAVRRPASCTPPTPRISGKSPVMCAGAAGLALTAALADLYFGKEFSSVVLQDLPHAGRIALATQNVLKNGAEILRVAFPSELLDGLRGVLTERSAESLILIYATNHCGKRIRIACILEDQPIFAVMDDLRNACSPRYDHRQTTGHCLLGRHCKRVFERWTCVQISCGKVELHIFP